MHFTAPEKELGTNVQNNPSHFVVVQTLDINLVPVARPARRSGGNSYDLGVQIAGKDAIMTLVDISITYHKFNSESK